MAKLKEISEEPTEKRSGSIAKLTSVFDPSELGWRLHLAQAAEKVARHRWLNRRAHLFYRWLLPRPYRHMAIAGCRLSLSPEFQPNDRRAIYWDRKLVGELEPLCELRKTQGGDCFFVGTGPSMAEVDLNCLRGKTTFGVNGAILKFEQSNLRPAYYAITDPDFFENRFDAVEKVLKSGCRCFLSAAGLKLICERDPGLLAGSHIHLLETVNRRYGHARLEMEAYRAWVQQQKALWTPADPTTDLVGFSRDIALGVFCGRTILFRALQVGAYLGYERLWILGMDLGFTSKPRFYETQAQMRPSQLDADYEKYILPSFKVLREVCLADPAVKVFNLSPTTRLPAEVIPRSTLDSALHCSPPLAQEGEA